MAVNEDWLSKNDGRNYPLVDGTVRQVGGRTMPTNLLVDLHVGLSDSYIGQRLYLSTVSLAWPRVVLEIAAEASGPLLALDVQQPQAYRNYQLTAVDGADGANAHGFVCFGSGIGTGLTSYQAQMTVDDSQILPSLITYSPGLPFAYAGDGRTQLTGVVELLGEDGVQVAVKTLDLPGGLQQAIVIELQDDIEVLEAPLQPCQLPLESGKISGRHPVLSINGVYPDADGQLTLELQAEKFTSVDPLTEEETELPVLEVSAASYLAFKANIPNDKVCGSKTIRTIVYGTPRCIGCTDTQIQQADIQLGQVFIQRDYLVIEFVYGGAYSLVYNAPAGPPTLDHLVIAVDSLYSNRNGVGPKFIYDVDENCDPASPSAGEGITGRLVWRLNKIVRNTSCTLTVMGPQGMMKESATPVPSGYELKLSPEFSLCQVQIRDPFTFDSSFMDAQTAADINQEILDYIAGNPPWVEPASSGV